MVKSVDMLFLFVMIKKLICKSIIVHFFQFQVWYCLLVSLYSIQVQVLLSQSDRQSCLIHFWWISESLNGQKLTIVKGLMEKRMESCTICGCCHQKLCHISLDWQNLWRIHRLYTALECFSGLFLIIPTCQNPGRVKDG